jgi:putative SOS response-associated peptidase YedK
MVTAQADEVLKLQLKVSALRFVTTEAKRSRWPIHPKAMPVIILAEKKIETWMTATAEGGWS